MLDKHPKGMYTYFVSKINFLTSLSLTDPNMKC